MDITGYTTKDFKAYSSIEEHNKQNLDPHVAKIESADKIKKVASKIMKAGGSFFGISSAVAGGIFLAIKFSAIPIALSSFVPPVLIGVAAVAGVALLALGIAAVVHKIASNSKKNHENQLQEKLQDHFEQVFMQKFEMTPELQKYGKYVKDLDLSKVDKPYSPEEYDKMAKAIRAYTDLSDIQVSKNWHDALEAQEAKKREAFAEEKVGANALIKSLGKPETPYNPLVRAYENNGEYFVGLIRT